MTRDLSLAEARRIALAAQGLARSRPAGPVGIRRLRSTFDRIGVLQIDSVNVLTRAHHLPFFSRLGAYDRDRLDRWLWREGPTFEYMVHEAAIADRALHPLMRHRMEAHRRRHPLDADTFDFVQRVRAEVSEHGPRTASELADGGSRTGPWWGLSRGQQALRHLYRIGELAIADRRPTFEVVYDLPERVLPVEILDTPTPDDHDAHRRLVLAAARAHGVGTAADLADYHRLKTAPARRALDELVSDGVLEAARVESWNDPAYLDPGAAVPRRATGCALLSPFDPVVWFRPRLERLFGFHYRIEIYVPEAKRQYGYYVLPFLLGDRLVARVDLKADRRASVLRVRGAFAEPDRATTETVDALRAELERMAGWLGLAGVTAGRRGDLVAGLGFPTDRDG